MYNEESEHDMLDDIQKNRPGSSERMAREKEWDSMFDGGRVDPKRSNITMLRREIYESIGSKNKPS
jgi:hypothetical protein